MIQRSVTAVSYTHLDVYKRQLQLCARLGHTPKQAAETVADAAARRAGEKRDDITVAVLALSRR